MTAPTMLTLDEIRRRLADRNVAEVARRLGESRQRIHKIATGKTKRPYADLWKRLSDYLLAV